MWKCLFVILFIVPFYAFGQTQLYKTNKIKRYSNPILTENNFFQVNQEELGLNLNTKMQLYQSKKDKRGNLHSKYHQYYKNIQIVGGTYILHSKNGVVNKSNGSLYPDVSIDVVPVLDKNEIEGFAKEAFLNILTEDKKVNADLVFISTPKLVIIDGKYPNFSGNYKLAYAVICNYESTKIHQKRVLYMDALNGELILHFSKITHTNIIGKGVSNLYGEVEINMDSIAPNKFLLRDDSRGAGIVIKDYSTNDVFENDTKNWDFIDDKNGAIDAMYGTQKFYDFLEEKFGRNSIDDMGIELEAKVNRYNYVNASWNGKRASFGSGDCNDHLPLTTLSIVGHEFTHGLTDYTSDLVYAYEPGALNEGMSDVFGEALEYYFDPNGADWLIGAKFLRNVDVDPFRSMSDPNVYKDPKCYKGEYWKSSSAVHSNSGVFNHWFYLLVNGGSGENEFGTSYSLSGIGMDDAIDIVYQMQVYYLTENSNYSDAFSATLASVLDLFPSDNSILLEAKEAWKAVGLKELIASDFNFYFNDMEAQVNGFCMSSLQDFDLSIYSLLSEKIDMGTSVHFKTKITYNNGNESISKEFNEEVVLDEDWLPEESIDLNYHLVNVFNVEDDMVQFEIEISYLKDGQLKSNLLKKQIIFTDFSEDNYYGNLKVRYSNPCSEDSDFRVSSFVNNWGCLNFDTINNRFKVIIDNGFEVDSTILTYPVSSFSDEIVYVRLVQDSLPIQVNLEQTTIELWFLVKDKYVFIDDVSTEDFLYVSLNIGQEIKFDEDQDLDYFQVDPCWYCNLEIENEQLVFTDNIDDLEACYTLDEYKEFIFGSYKNTSTIEFCMDTENMESPYLSFDLKLENPIGVDENLWDYSHLVRISKGYMPLQDLFITTDTDNKFKHFNIPLIKNDDRIEIEVMTIDAKAIFDNIKVVEESSLSANERTLTNFHVTNPVSDFIHVQPTENQESWSFELFNIQGVKILGKDKNSGENRIAAKHIVPGIYFYRIIDKDNNLITGKIIKQ